MEYTNVVVYLHKSMWKWRHNGTIVHSFSHKISAVERILILYSVLFSHVNVFLILSSIIQGLQTKSLWSMYRRRIKVCMRDSLEPWYSKSWFSSSKPGLQSPVTQFIRVVERETSELGNVRGFSYQSPKALDEQCSKVFSRVIQSLIIL